MKRALATLGQRRGAAAPLRDQFGCWAPAGEVLEGDECGSRLRWGFGDGGRCVMAALGESCWKDPEGLLQKLNTGVGVDVGGSAWEWGGNP